MIYNDDNNKFETQLNLHPRMITMSVEDVEIGPKNDKNNMITEKSGTRAINKIAIHSGIKRTER